MVIISCKIRVIMQMSVAYSAQLKLVTCTRTEIYRIHANDTLGPVYHKYCYYEQPADFFAPKSLTAICVSQHALGRHPPWQTPPPAATGMHSCLMQRILLVSRVLESLLVSVAFWVNKPLLNTRNVECSF